jgi:hypothetical protein
MHVIKRATRTFMCRCIQVVSQKTSIWNWPTQTSFHSTSRFNRKRQLPLLRFARDSPSSSTNTSHRRTNKDDDSIRAPKVTRTPSVTVVALVLIRVDEKRRRIILCLKPLTADMEKIHSSTMYHVLKRACSEIVEYIPITRPHSKLFPLGYLLHQCSESARTLQSSSICSSAWSHFHEAILHTQCHRPVRSFVWSSQAVERSCLYCLELPRRLD